MDVILQRLATGPATAAELCALTGLSQPSMARLLAKLRSRVLPMGQARARRYGLLRQIRDLPAEVPLYRITALGQSQHLGWISALAGGGFWFNATADSTTDAHFYPDLPWWLMDSRPQGFLGRMWPLWFPELSLPSDVRQWDSSAVFHALARRGDYLWGDMLLGEVAYARWWEAQQRGRAPAIPTGARLPAYSESAAQALQGIATGSSPGGEQPKFSSIVEAADGESQEVLVKFSAAADNPIAQRWADLLIAEHLALEALRSFGLPAAQTELLWGEGRTFLQVQRFDRLGSRGRRAVVSFETADAEFAGVGGSWPRIARALAKDQRLPPEDVTRVEQLAAFGHLIGNTDMHLGNLSLYHHWPEGTYGRFSLAPVYDMLPMRYAPVAGELRPPLATIPAPVDGLLPAYAQMQPLAVQYWQAVYAHEAVSAGFKTIAAAMSDAVAALRL